MANLAEFRFRVSKKIGLDQTTGGDEQQLVDIWLNDAVTHILARTHCYISKATATTTPGENDYILDFDAIKVLKILLEDGTPLHEVTPDRIFEMRRVMGGVTTSWWYSLDGADLISFYPTPDGEVTFIVYYVPKPRRMNSPTNDPSDTEFGGIPVEWHRLIELYALAEAGDYDDDKSSAQGQRYWDLFEKELAEFKKLINRKGGRKRPRFEVPPFDNPYPVGDRSADWA